MSSKPDGWTMGWPYRLTGEQEIRYGSRWLEAVWLDGPKTGQCLSLPHPEDLAIRQQARQTEYREQQEEFARLARAIVS